MRQSNFSSAVQIIVSPDNSDIRSTNKVKASGQKHTNFGYKLDDQWFVHNKDSEIALCRASEFSKYRVYGHILSRCSILIL